MGSGGNKSHESFAVAPGATLTTAGAEAAEAAGAPLPPQLVAALDAVQAHAGGPTGDATTAEQYQALKAAVDTAQQQLAAGIDETQQAAAADTIKQATGQFLTGLPLEEMVALAGDAGFAHPHLVGLSGHGTAHPLVHYLDPAYPDDIASKAAIAAKAEQRYAQLAAGEVVHGLTLADVTALEQQLPHQKATASTGQGTGPVSAEQALALSAQVTAAATVLAASAATSPHQHPDPTLVTALVTAENALATATCPDASAALSAAQLAARGHVDQVVAKLPIKTVKQALADPNLNAAADPNARYLAARDQLALLRENTEAVTRTQLQTQLAERVAAAAALQPAGQALTEAKNTTFSKPIDPAALPGFAGAAGDAFAAAKAIIPWRHNAFDPATGTTPAELSAHEIGSPDTLTAQFNVWAKQQQLTDLRTAATTVGLTDAAAATRAHVTKYIAGAWDPSLHQPTIQAQVSGKATAKAAEKPSTTTSSTTTSSGQAPAVNPVAAVLGAGPTSSTTPAAAASAAAKKGTLAAPPAAAAWMAQHQRLVDALKHHQASASVLPARNDPTTVAAWTFTATSSAANLGGVHSKTFVPGPDGSTWMFKPDGSAGGARAHAESAAARIYHAVGIPAVDVHVTSVGGKTGSVQPMLPGVGQLPASPASWTQGDVDAIVRYHVAAWAVGDHDGGPANVLRTGSGGLVPCDAGQAFKFYGRDKLSSDYNPNAGYGSPKAVFHQAYAAAASKSLAAGVTIRPEAAAGVLDAFERLPDSQYKALLHHTAHEGAKYNVHWVEPMRKAAAKHHGIPADKVSTAQIAEQFLDHAVTRKHQLRAQFTAFFTDHGFAGAAKLADL